MAGRLTRGNGTMVLDADGLAKLAQDDERALAHLTVALRQRHRVVVSAVTLTEVLRGGPRDTAVHRTLKRVSVEPVTPAQGRAAGELLGSTGMGGDNAIDALVAATALAKPGPVVVLTSDPQDLRRLTSSRNDVTIAIV